MWRKGVDDFLLSNKARSWSSGLPSGRRYREMSRGKLALDYGTPTCLSNRIAFKPNTLRTYRPLLQCSVTTSELSSDAFDLNDILRRIIELQCENDMYEVANVD